MNIRHISGKTSIRTSNNRANKNKKRPNKKRPGWKIYQSRLKKSQARAKSVRKWLKGSILFIFLAVTVYGITGKPSDSAVHAPEPRSSLPKLIDHPAAVPLNNIPPNPAHDIPAHDLIDKNDIQDFIDKDLLNNIKERNFDIDFDGRQFHIGTTIDPALQNFILSSMRHENARYIGIVAINPQNGEILSLAGYDKENPGRNPCIENIFPAASIFKIITAAAVVEKYGFTSDTAIAYKGGKHTLYKYQLKKQPKNHVQLITLQDSFAQSVNPVFGKLGVHYLGKTDLETFAKAFGFKRSFHFEIPVEPSVISISEQPFHLAEIASGFNRTTAISPLHGALITSAITSGNGKILEPYLIERISDKSGRIIYQNCSSTTNQAVKPKTARIVKKLMKETVLTGTCRKAFRGYKKNPVLSRLDIGGKTGSINSRKHEGQRFDWFVGFANEKKGDKQIVLSVIVVHKDFIGIKARQYAKMIFEEYYKNYFTEKLTALRPFDKLRERQ
ncbi:penicillin-binding transpeptidase domain-containing protein [Desulfobacterales bacterium HSG17]|nr:penicillin-binding transpeptidase domain-containing protein [Desulfobacterales bacterium HSG17]